MSQVDAEPVAEMTTAPTAKCLRALSIPESFILALGVIFAPRRVGTLWQRITLWRAAIVAALNLAALPAWVVAFAMALQLWSGQTLYPPPMNKWAPNIPTLIKNLWVETLQLGRAIAPPGVYNRFLAGVGFSLMALLLVALVFFVLLPFAARPGANRACVRHVMRAAFLASSFIHYWLGALTLTLVLMLLCRVESGMERLYPVFAVTCMLLAGTLWVMIRAVRVEYRRQEDFPQPKTPQCDECGYDLHMTSPDSRCPECGKPVAESLDASFRPPTSWEKSPHLGECKIVRKQLVDIVLRPRDLFFHMPTLTGQRSAQRWLLLAMTGLALIAFWTVPAGLVQLHYGPVDSSAPAWATQSHGEIDWSWGLAATVLFGGGAMGIFWAIFGLLMVGVETGGVAAVAHFRKQHVALAASAKVTCYSSPLMAVWAVLGGLQIVLLVVAYQRGWMFLRPWVEQVALVASTAIAHIGGLLWFEFTVYRGLRAIQYANH